MRKDSHLDAYRELWGSQYIIAVLPPEMTVKYTLPRPRPRPHPYTRTRTRRCRSNHRPSGTAVPEGSSTSSNSILTASATRVCSASCWRTSSALTRSGCSITCGTLALALARTLALALALARTLALALALTLASSSLSER